MKERKKKRARNFLEQEKLSLLNLTNEYKDIIGNKRIDAVTCRMKHETWDIITQRFNSTAKSGIRTAQQLKELYEAIKKMARKKRMTKLEVCGTGSAKLSSNFMDNIVLCSVEESSNNGPMQSTPEKKPFSQSLEIETPLSQLSEPLTDVLIELKRKRHNKKIEILEIVKEREKLELEIKKVELQIKKAEFERLNT